MLKPKTSCREVVRQVQALFRLRGGPCVSQEDSAYVQARGRLPVERMEKALSATAQTATENCADAYGWICCSTSPEIWCPTGRIAVNQER